MAGVLPRLKQGPDTYTVAALVLGGQLVCPNSTTAGDQTIKVVPTGGPVSGVLGVAATDANTGQYPEGAVSTPGGWAGDGSLTTQNQLLDQSILNYSVAVYNNVDIRVNYDGAVLFGQFLTWSASVAGAVTAYTGTDPKAIVGKCTQPGGVAAAGVARAYIRVV